jgi:hypothetical protein
MALLTGCALESNPQPPTLWLPAPVKDLTARRVANEVHMHWNMPRETTDKVALKGPQKAHFCWEPTKPGVAPGKAGFSCTAAGDGTFAPGKPADFTAALPSEWVAEAPRAVAYFVELQNPAGKTAGLSNAALVATGPAPSAVTGFHLSTQPGGVVLHWTADAPEPGLVLRIHRALVKAAAGKTGQKSNGAPPQARQTLEVDLSGEDRGEALDRDATLDHVWTYWAERVRRVDTDHQRLEVAGLPSPAETIDAKDVFPPAVPRGLAAVADTQTHAIGLSWIPDSDADLAGYVVYRRDVTAGAAQARISGAKPLVPPSFTDRNVIAGHRYAYSVSAVSENRNESARSSEVEEEFPQ